LQATACVKKSTFHTLLSDQEKRADQKAVRLQLYWPMALQNADKISVSGLGIAANVAIDLFQVSFFSCFFLRKKNKKRA